MPSSVLTLSGVALAVGLGAASAPAAGGPVLRLDGERILLSEDGASYSELRLGDSAAAQRLRRLLAREGTAAVRRGPTRLAGSGGCGYHWTPDDSSAEGAQSSAATAHKG